MIVAYGGTEGLRDNNLLELSIFKPMITLFGEDAYSTLALKSAALLFSIIKNHPFLDGNKRTGFAAMHLMLLSNGHDLTSTTVQEVKMCLSVATDKKSIDEIAKWIEKNSKKI